VRTTVTNIRGKDVLFPRLMNISCSFVRGGILQQDDGRGKGNE